jgi:lipopolysaccharide/colanic/teichoic acid biosynthesis glycosyltransferase
MDMRRLVDLMLGGVLLLVSSPLLALVAAMNWVTSRRVFFRQTRIGLGLRPFTILKFQTMVDGADAAGTVTARGDSRITPLGHILRATKMDELPQLINVVKGEMSLVGPRPLPPNEIAAIPSDLAHRVYTVRPGMTGVAQLAFAHEEQLLGASQDPQATYFEVVLPEKIALELAYAGRRTWATDLAILALTPIAGLSPRFARAAAIRLAPSGPAASSSSASAV